MLSCKVTLGPEDCRMPETVLVRTPNGQETRSLKGGIRTLLGRPRGTVVVSSAEGGQVIAVAVKQPPANDAPSRGSETAKAQSTDE